MEARTCSSRTVRLTAIVQLHMLLKRLDEKDIHLIPSEELIAYISSTGCDPRFVARPVKRTIQKELMNELSRQIIAGKVETRVKQVIDVFGNIRPNKIFTADKRIILSVAGHIGTTKYNEVVKGITTLIS